MVKKREQMGSDQGSGREDCVEMEGMVQEALPGTFFKVKTDNGLVVLATLAGRLRKNRIRVLPNDKVTIEVSPYDPTRGRITWRA